MSRLLACFSETIFDVYEITLIFFRNSVTIIHVYRLCVLICLYVNGKYFSRKKGIYFSRNAANYFPEFAAFYFPEFMLFYIKPAGV